MKPFSALWLGILGVITLGYFQVECRSSSPWSVWHKYSSRNRIYSSPIRHQRTSPRTSSKSSSSTLDNGRWVIRGGRHVWMPYKWSAPPPPSPKSTLGSRTDRRREKYPQSTYLVYRVDRLSPLQALVSKVKAKVSPLRSLVNSVKTQWDKSGKNAVRETKNSFRTKIVGDWDFKPRNTITHKRQKSRTSMASQKGSEIKWQANVGIGQTDRRNRVLRKKNMTAGKNAGRLITQQRQNTQRNDKKQRNKTRKRQPPRPQGKRTLPSRPPKNNRLSFSKNTSRGGKAMSKEKGAKAWRSSFAVNNQFGSKTSSKDSGSGSSEEDDR